MNQTIFFNFNNVYNSKQVNLLAVKFKVTQLCIALIGVLFEHSIALTIQRAPNEIIPKDRCSRQLTEYM